MLRAWSCPVTEAFLKRDIRKGSYFRNCILMSYSLGEHLQGLYCVLRNLEGEGTEKGPLHPGMADLTYSPSTWEAEEEDQTWLHNQ